MTLSRPSDTTPAAEFSPPEGATATILPKKCSPDVLRRGLTPAHKTLPAIGLAMRPAAAVQSGHGSIVLPLYMDRS